VIGLLHQEIVVENQRLAREADIYRLVLKGTVADTAQPGQFVHIKVGSTLDPLLRRPISVAGINRPNGEITLFYRVAGRGTRLLAGVRPGESLSLLGPVGKGFTLPTAGELLLVAGGIGIFPLFALVEAVDRSQVKVKMLWGGANRDFLEAVGRETLFQMGVDYAVASLDGSMGQPGLVTDLLASELNKKGFLVPETGEGNLLGSDAGCPEDWGRKAGFSVAACGPRGMLRAVTELCIQAGAPVEVSLEERMACGVGACLGCVCTVRTTDGALERKRVCQDGPVFDGREVVWDEKD
jgi:dihydroorotate dehydrogenase electron transfer subunit